MVKLVNKTPHEVIIYTRGSIVRLPKPEVAARCREDRRFIDLISACDSLITINQTRYTSLEGLPEPEEGTLFVVSQIAAEAAKEVGRTDVLCVDELCRDSEGRVFGCKSLRYP